VNRSLVGRAGLLIGIEFALILGVFYLTKDLAMRYGYQRELHLRTNAISNQWHRLASNEPGVALGTPLETAEFHRHAVRLQQPEN
jgi:hypothetical protein